MKDVMHKYADTQLFPYFRKLFNVASTGTEGYDKHVTHDFKFVPHVKYQMVLTCYVRDDITLDLYLFQLFPL